MDGKENEMIDNSITNRLEIVAKVGKEIAIKIELLKLNLEQIVKGRLSREKRRKRRRLLYTGRKRRACFKKRRNE